MQDRRGRAILGRAKTMGELKDKLAGKFIVIDGPDGAGKSTQVALLGDFFRGCGVRVREARDPGGTAIGDRIREILLDGAHGEMAVACELMLYMASRAQLAAEVIRPALDRGECVLCDRYIASTLAYQGAGGADTRAIRDVAEVAVGGLWPDLTVVLDLPADAGLARSGKAAGPDRMESKPLTFHRKVRRMFLALAEQDPDHVVVLDAAGTIEDVQRRLRDTLEKWEFA